LAGVEPAHLGVRVTPNDLLITADVNHDHEKKAGKPLLCEFAPGPVFRSYRFPHAIDTQKVKADYRNGLLKVTAPLAKGARVEVRTESPTTE
jgi:HSP20 family protein